MDLIQRLEEEFDLELVEAASREVRRTGRSPYVGSLSPHDQRVPFRRRGRGPAGHSSGDSLRGQGKGHSDAQGRNPLPGNARLVRRNGIGWWLRSGDEGLAMACCANPDQLERLVQDRLEDVERETVAAHVQDCKACQDILDRLTVSPGATLSTEEEEPWTEREARLVQNLKSQGPPRFDAAYLRALGAEQDERRDPAAKSAIHAADAVDAAPSDDPYPSIAGFSIVREIGRGGMGVVYEAES